MASRRKKVAKAVPFNAADLANIAKANPYLQRLIDDSDLRDNVRTAIDSAKSAYDRLVELQGAPQGPARGQEASGRHQRRAKAVREPPSRSPMRRRRQGHKQGQAPRPQARGRSSSAAGPRWSGQREAALEGARHAVRRRGGVPVHAARGTPAAPPASPVTAG